MKNAVRFATLSALSLAVAAQLGMPRTAFAQSNVAPRKHIGNIKWTPGRVALDGTVAEGNTFTAMRIDTGDYVLTFPVGAFPKYPPIVTCSAAGVDAVLTICNVWAVTWDPTEPATVEIRLFGLNGAAQDNAFNFTEMTPQ